MDNLTHYLNDPQLSEYLNFDENENPKPPSKKTRSFQTVVRELVLSHVREVEDSKESYKKGTAIIVKRYKATKDEKLILKSKLDYWSEECKKLQFENSKLLSFLKNGLCSKCDKLMKTLCGTSDFSEMSHEPESADLDLETMLSDKSADNLETSVNEGNHVSSSDGHATDDTSPASASKNRKLKLMKKDKRCRYSATSVKLRRSPSKLDKTSSPKSKKLSKRVNESSRRSPTTRKSLLQRSPSKDGDSSFEKPNTDEELPSFVNQTVRFYDVDRRSSEDDIIMESPQMKKLRVEIEPARLVSPRLSKLKLTQEANRVNRREGRVMKFRGKKPIDKTAVSPSLFDVEDAHELTVNHENAVSPPRRNTKVLTSPRKRKTRPSPSPKKRNTRQAMSPQKGVTRQSPSPRKRITRQSPQKQSTRLSVKENLSRGDRNLHYDHSVSIQSTPSPSVLSGNMPNFISDDRSADVGSPRLKNRLSKKKDDAIELDLENSGSPVSSAKQKKFVQTKITHEMFMPPADTVNKEMKEIKEAIKRSLDVGNSAKDAETEASSRLSSENSCIESIDAFTVPPITSTPFSKDTTETFKKPQIPKKGPATPKRKGPLGTSSPRTSPRLKRNNKKTEVESMETGESISEFDVSVKNASKNRPSKSRRSLEMDTMQTNPQEVTISAQNQVNGSIDPQVSLSLYETAPDDLGKERSQPSSRSRSQIISNSPSSAIEVLQSPSESESLDLTCQSVIFGPPKTTNNQKKNLIMEVSSNSPDKVTYIPETMDMDYVSDYEDAVHEQIEQEPTMTNSLPEMLARKGSSKNDTDPNIPFGHENSFDYVPKDNGPDYAYADVVRKRGEREQLKSYTCKECEAYFNADGAAGDNLKFCRHKARYVPPSTPEHFWDMTLEDTQIAQERGYMNITQGKASKFRRKRKLNKLFKSKDESGSEEYFEDLV